MAAMTPDEMKAFQAVFQHAADTLPQRVLGGRQLVWKQGAFDSAMQKLRAAKRALEDEIGRAPLGGGSAPAWQAAKPSQHGRSGLAMGAHRQPSQGPGGLLSDLKTAAKRQGVHTDGLALLIEGAKSGVELRSLDPGKVVPTGAIGFYPDLEPQQEFAIKAFADILKSSGVFDEAMVGSASEMASEIAGCLPILGAVTNLGSGVVNGLKAASRAWDLRKLDKMAVMVTPGNPTAALGAVRVLFERKRTEFALIAAMDGAAGGMQLTGLFVDLGAATGPALGIAKAALKLAHAIFLSLRNFHDFRKANKVLLANGPYEASLVGACPILGCYLITEAEHSTLMAFLGAGTLPPNWMDLVEQRKNDIEALVRLANLCQREAPFALRGYENRFSTPSASLKGEHFLDFRMHKGAQRAAHEANMILKRDPRGLRFFSKHLLSRIGL